MGSFAAIINDDDSSAFVTKNEFDVMKSDFKNQIEGYSNNLADKIDGAIASYLSNYKVALYNTNNALLKQAADNYVITFNNSNKLEYGFAWPRIELDITQTLIANGSNVGTGVAKLTAKAADISDSTRIKKTVIDSLKQYNGVWVAAFEGYRINCDDYIVLYNNTKHNSSTDSNPSVIGGANWSKQSEFRDTTGLIVNTKLVGSDFTAYLRTTNGTSLTQGTTPIYSKPHIQIIKHDWGTNKYPHAICWQPYNYDMFSNKERDYNFGYNGSYMTTFDGWSNQRWTSLTQSIPSWLSKTTKSGTIEYMYKPYGSSTSSGSKTINWTSNMVTYAGGASGTLYVPMIGFEKTYLNNWNQIYQKDTNAIANWDSSKYSSSIAGSIIQASENEKYLSVSAGLPIAKLGEAQGLYEFNVDFEDKTKNYIIWVSDRPFPSNADPKDSSNLVALTGLDKVESLKGYKIKNGVGKFGCDNENRKEKYLYIKWGILTSDTVCTCGGAMKVDKTYIVVNK